MIATITPNPCLDLSLMVDHMVKDDAVRVRSFRKYAGGKGICVSRVLRRLGRNPITITCLGGHSGDEVRALLDEEDIRSWTVSIRRETRTNIIVYEDDGRSLTRLHMKGPAVTDLELEEFWALIQGLPSHVEYVAMGGSLLEGFPADFYLQAGRALRERGVRLILDADKDELRTGISLQPFMIKPNEYELGRLVGRTIEGRDEAVRAARELVERGVEMVVVSMGKRGAVAVVADGAVWASAPPVDTRSTVGSGDSMVAAIIHAHAQGERDPGRLLSWGAAAGAATAITPGTELCHREDVLRLLEEVTVESL